MSAIPDNDLKRIITDPEATQTLVQQAEQFGKKLADAHLTTSQIRALFGEVRQIEAMWGMGSEQRARARRRLILLKPKMAYRAKKERGAAVRDLVDVLTPAVDLVTKESDQDKQNGHFNRFVEFFEAVLAYHKANGGS
ncbi:MAG: type III-A CRISPR-associated protein Csm2 [Aggregatilineales bacterium]